METVYHGPTEPGLAGFWHWYSHIMGSGWAIFFALLGLGMFLFGLWASYRNRAKGRVHYTAAALADAEELQQLLDQASRTKTVVLFRRFDLPKHVQQLGDQHQKAWRYLEAVQWGLYIGPFIAVTPFWVQVMRDRLAQ